MIAIDVRTDRREEAATTPNLPTYSTICRIRRREEGAAAGHRIVPSKRGIGFELFVAAAAATSDDCFYRNYVIGRRTIAIAK
jgi:hypothetical protein